MNAIARMIAGDTVGRADFFETGVSIAIVLSLDRMSLVAPNAISQIDTSKRMLAIDGFMLRNPLECEECGRVLLLDAAIGSQYMR